MLQSWLGWHCLTLLEQNTPLSLKYKGITSIHHKPARPLRTAPRCVITTTETELTDLIQSSPYIPRNLIHTYTHTYILTYIHTLTHTCTHRDIHRHTHIHTHTYTVTHIYIHTHIHTCTHTQTYIHTFRARHWCLPRCPGQVELVNYSCRASENCILLAPLGKHAVYILGLLLRMCANFVVWHPSLS